MHDDPERRALAQPRHDVAARAGGAGTSRLAHHAGAHDESHVRHEVVRCVARARTHAALIMVETPQEQTSHATPESLARARKHTRRVINMVEIEQENTHTRSTNLRRAPADAPVTRIEFPGHSATPNRMCAMPAVAGSVARSYDRPRRTTRTMRVAAM